MIKKIIDSHNFHNDLKGTDRRVIIFAAKDLVLENSKPKHEEFSLDKFIALNWIAHDVYATSKVKERITFEKLKGVTLNYDAKEQKENTEKIRTDLLKYIGTEKYLYIVYFIGGNRDIIVTDVSTLTEKEYKSL